MKIGKLIATMVFASAIMMIGVPARALEDPDPRCTDADCCAHCVRLHKECDEMIQQQRATAAKLLKVANDGAAAQAAVKAKAEAAAKPDAKAKPDVPKAAR